MLTALKEEIFFTLPSFYKENKETEEIYEIINVISNYVISKQIETINSCDKINNSVLNNIISKKRLTSFDEGAISILKSRKISHETMINDYKKMLKP